jgi:hypothetical protein
MTIKKYIIVNGNMDDSFDLVVEIDSEKFSEIQRELFDFHGLLEDYDDDEALERLLKRLGCRVFQMSAQGQSEESIIREFKVGEEGWPQMDGSWGINIVSIDSFDFSVDDFEVDEL